VLFSDEGETAGRLPTLQEVAVSGSRDRDWYNLSLVPTSSSTNPAERGGKPKGVCGGTGRGTQGSSGRREQLWTNSVAFF